MFINLLSQLKVSYELIYYSVNVQMVFQWYFKCVLSMDLSFMGCLMDVVFIGRKGKSMLVVTKR